MTTSKAGRTVSEIGLVCEALVSRSLVSMFRRDRRIWQGRIQDTWLRSLP